MDRSGLQGTELDVANLQLELQRLGAHREREGVVAVVTFAELHDDPRCEQLFEALVGTLRAAKKRGKIAYKGELLLKGPSDGVEIELLVPPPEGMVPQEATIHVAGGAPTTSSSSHNAPTTDRRGSSGLVKAHAQIWSSKPADDPRVEGDQGPSPSSVVKSGNVSNIASSFVAPKLSPREWAEALGEDGINELTVTDVAELGPREFEAMSPEQLTVLLEKFETDLTETQKVALLEVIDSLDEDEDEEEDDQDEPEPVDVSPAMKKKQEEERADKARLDATMERLEEARLAAEADKARMSEEKEKRLSETRISEMRLKGLADEAKAAEEEAKRKAAAAEQQQQKREAAAKRAAAAEEEAKRKAAAAAEQQQKREAAERAAAEKQKREAAERAAAEEEAAKRKAAERAAAEKQKREAAERAAAEEEAAKRKAAERAAAEKQKREAAERAAAEEEAAKREAAERAAAEEEAAKREAAERAAAEEEAAKREAAERAAAEEEAAKREAAERAAAEEEAAERAAAELKKKLEEEAAAAVESVVPGAGKNREEEATEPKECEEETQRTREMKPAKASNENDPPRPTSGASSEYSNAPEQFQASVDNLDWEIETKKKSKLAEEANDYRNALRWVLAVTGESVDEDIEGDGHVAFGNALQDGVLLCKLVNSIKPKTVPNAKKSSTAFIQLSNITSFNRGCQKLGLQKRECFDAQDLQKQLDLRPALHTLHALSRVAKNIPGYDGPLLTAPSPWA
ncbi:hypothetical protein CTAYLR_001417 [Chrysophaeum taylorii]|uniref:Calponin-homology (CH) domain-containing protein n=1 Tax=Chrysophaeum taylorii TaxID=2483200 RepID=A0AAD7U9C5_9STRA|nr:hypothetical protein CTAYLR_001417 [Chrysophaeum taylorii]